MNDEQFERLVKMLRSIRLELSCLSWTLAVIAAMILILVVFVVR